MLQRCEAIAASGAPDRVESCCRLGEVVAVWVKVESPQINHYETLFLQRHKVLLRQLLRRRCALLNE